MNRDRASLVGGLRVMTAVLLLIGIARSADVAGQAQGVSPADEAVIRSLVERYYAAYAAKDLATLTSMWNQASPELRATTNMFRAVFQFQDFAFSNLRIARIRPDQGGAAARVIVDASVANTATKRTDAQHWVRNLSLRRDGQDWAIWGDSLAGNDLVAELGRLETEDQRLARIADEPDLSAEQVREILDREANRAFAARDNERAIAFNLLRARLAERAGDQAGVASSYINIGFVHQARMDHHAALEWFQKAAPGFQAAGKVDRYAATEMNIGSEFYVLRDYRQAGEHYQKALDAFEKTEERGWIPTIHHSLGNVAYLQGNWDIALEHYGKSVALLEGADLATAGGSSVQARGIATAYQAMGLVYKEQGDYPSALAALEKSLDRFKRTSDHPGALQVHEAMGLVYRLAGDYALSLKQYLTAQRIMEALPPVSRDIQVEANLLAETGDVYALEQRYATALDYLQRSLVLQERAKSQEGVAAVLGGIGGMHFILGRLDEALGYYRKGLAIREARGDKRHVARLLAHVGLVLAAQNKHADARASYEKSLEIANGDDDRTGSAIALVLIAAADVAQGNADAALESASKGAAIATDLGNLDILAHAHLVTGDACQRRGDMDRARQALGESITAVGRIRSLEMPDEGRFFNDTVAPYVAMVHLLLAEDRSEEAFAYLERARLVRMQAVLGGGTSVAKGLMAEEKEEERQIRKRVVSLRTRVRKAADQPRPDQARLAALSADLADATATQAGFASRLYERHPELKELRAKGDPVGLTDGAAEVIDLRSGLLEYAVTESRTYLFVATKTSGTATGAKAAAASAAAPRLVVRVYPIEIKPIDLGKRIALFRDLIARRDPDLGAPARELYDLLLKPAEVQLAGKRRLLIVPDSVLWALPFQALQPQGGRYVIEDRAVAYAPSLTALAAFRQDERNRTALAASPLRLVALGLADAGKAALDRLALIRPDLTFEPLPEAEREVRAVSAVFAPARSRAYLGREARADRLLMDGRRTGTIHLAVRGILNDASPLHSVVTFVPAVDRSADDGIVETADVLGWEVSARTVVLSRLQADPMQTNAGAGAVALSWAWFVAGAPTSVLSSWVVDAPSTTLLMQGFHQYGRPVAGGAQPPARPSDALRLATLPLLQGKTRHPYYWAGFSVMGDTR